ncbi:MAG TPA: L-2-amino-thiazoline-4-carboxylic acid hydrolase, partial [Roseiarcus sp.]|nr:L-2-amino-thiazoline-4-carboxylic acid hydrolase [Roseiarcus sp.]
MTDHEKPTTEQDRPVPDAELGILQRRRIEAAIIKPIYDEMRQAIGEEKAREILRRAIRQAAIEAGKDVAAKTP